MKKNLSWKVLLAIGVVSFVIKFLVGGEAISALFEIVGLITLILGIIGFFTFLFSKKEKTVITEDTKKQRTFSPLFWAIPLIAIIIFISINASKQPTNVAKSDVSYQVECSDRGYRLFEANKDSEDGKTYAHQEYFNNRLNRCFSLIEANDDFLSRIQLYDVYENSKLAELGKSGSSVLLCYVKVDGESKSCNSYEEFINLVGFYMNS